MRHILSTILVALIVGALAGATVGAMAQSSPAEPANDDGAVEIAAINADTVDGQHAVKATWKKQQRKNKLVATNRQGLLPSNIVKPKWNLLRNVPAGFADGVDDVGVASVRVTTVSAPNVVISPGQERLSEVACPAGSIVVGGGAYGTNKVVHLSASFPVFGNKWRAYGTNTSTTIDYELRAYAVCMSIQPSGAVSVARKGVEPSGRRSR